MNSIPFYNCDIEDPNLLFGRKKILQSLCSHADALRQIQIIGARRYGKTCLIKSFISIQKSNSNRRTYPIYLDLSSDGIKGTANVYRYISAKIISALVSDNYIKESVLEIDEYSIKPFDNDKWRKVYAQLQEINDINTFGVFDEIVKKWSSIIHQTFLLLFDEYEYMAKKAFDSKEGPRHLRTISNDASNYLKFWLIGVYPWDVFVAENKLDDMKASGVFNGITQQKFVKPLSFPHFEEMWKHECSLISNKNDQMQIEGKCKDVFRSSGGIPYFAKEIGGFLYIEKQFPKYTLLNSHFIELRKILTKNDISILRDLQFTSKIYPRQTESLTKLEDYGIIEKDNEGKYFISCGFLSEYIRARIYQELEVKHLEDKSIDSLVEKIQDMIHAINEEWFKHNKKYMFDTTNNTTLYYRRMKSVCDNREKFANCISSIYLLYWEGAKEDSKAGAKIPKEFQWSIFRKSMDRIRHVFGYGHEQAKLETKLNQFDIYTALNVITGCDTEPQTPEEWHHFQKCLLNHFLQELNEIYESIKDQSTDKAKLHPSKTCKSNHRQITNKPIGLENGKDFDGVIVETTNQYGSTFLNVKCNQYPYPLQIRSRRDEVDVDDIVSFKAVVEPNKNDPQKKFWFAEDVHLK